MIADIVDLLQVSDDCQLQQFYELLLENSF
jgi:hypothetical protein